MSDSVSFVEVGAAADVLVNSYICSCRVENFSFVDWDDRNHNSYGFYTHIDLDCTDLKNMMCVIDVAFRGHTRLL